MRKVFILTIAIAIISIQEGFSQWEASGSNIYYNLGNVGIGLPSPTNKLHIVNNSSTVWGTFINNSSPSGIGLKVKAGSSTSSNAIFQLEDNSANVRFKVLSNGFIGIGTANPTSKLEIVENSSTNWGAIISNSNYYGKGLLVKAGYPYSEERIILQLEDASSNVRFKVLSNGNVGIGINNPQDNLVLCKPTNNPAVGINEGPGIEFNAPIPESWGGGVERLRINFGGPGLNISEKNSSTGVYEQIGYIAKGYSVFDGLVVDSDVPGINLQYYPNEDGAFELYGSNAKFHKKVWVKEEIVIQETCPFPDYVFEKEYALMSLSDLELYINEHNHLPEVPSAEEVKEKGINVAELNVVLLKKIEELTLHAIEQQKIIETLKDEMDQLKK